MYFSSLVTNNPGVHAKTLAGKCENLVLGLLMQYHGQLENSLSAWYGALKLGLPELEDTEQVRTVFQQLWEDDAIALSSPWIGNYTANSGDDLLQFLTLDRFTATLTRRGIARWDSIRRRPKSEEQEVARQAGSP